MSLPSETLRIFTNSLQQEELIDEKLAARRDDGQRHNRLAPTRHTGSPVNSPQASYAKSQPR